MLLFQVLAASLLWHASSATVAIPLPNGSYGVAYSTIELTNTKLLDPYAPTKQDRRVVVSAFYPTTLKGNCTKKDIPYMPPGTAAVYGNVSASYGLPSNIFEELSLTVCETNTTSSKHTAHLPHYPLVLFSPGLGDSRLLYSVIAENLAAQGFVVITVDHPYDATVVEFPDGSLVFAANISTLDQIDAALAIRAKDLSFLVSQLRNHTVVQDLLPGLYGTLDSTTVMAYGHSLGGATAAAAIQLDSRILGGINLDGTFFGSVVEEGLNHPFMIFAHQGKNQSTDDSWASIWRHLNSSKIQASVLGTQHASFQDYPVLFDVLNLRGRLPADQVASLIGTIRGQRIIEILTAYVAAFFDFVIGQSPAPLLHQKVSQFPEVTIANSTLAKG